MENKNRPTKKDTYRAVSMELAKNLMPYSAHGLGDDMDEVASDIEKALDMVWETNGYKLAKVLESRFGYDPDASMVEDLDCADNMISVELRKMTKVWMEETGSEPPAKEGDQVSATWGREEIHGTVNQVDMDGTMSISIDETGRCPIVKWETVNVIKTKEPK